MSHMTQDHLPILLSYSTPTTDSLTVSARSCTVRYVWLFRYLSHSTALSTLSLVVAIIISEWSILLSQVSCHALHTSLSCNCCLVKSSSKIRLDTSSGSCSNMACNNILVTLYSAFCRKEPSAERWMIFQGTWQSWGLHVTAVSSAKKMMLSVQALHSYIWKHKPSLLFAYFKLKGPAVRQYTTDS